jgi:hypothetical protein
MIERKLMIFFVIALAVFAACQGQQLRRASASTRIASHR